MEQPPGNTTRAILKRLLSTVQFCEGESDNAGKRIPGAGLMTGLQAVSCHQH